MQEVCRTHTYIRGTFSLRFLRSQNHFPKAVSKSSMTTLAYSNSFTPVMAHYVPEHDVGMKEEEEKTIPFLR